MDGTTGPGDVRAAISRAAQATGVDFGYLLAQARLESGLNPNARARTSSATGLYQFTNSTWLRTLDKHGADHGYDWAGSVIENGSVRDPALRQQIMSMRSDPQLSALMAGELANDNRNYLFGVLGRQPGNSELYLAHFLGAEGAGRFLTAMATDPSQSAAALLPQAAASNRSIFYDDSGAPRSLQGVMSLLSGRLAAAGGATGSDMAWAGGYLPAAPGNVMPVDSTPTFTGGPIAQEFQATAYAAGQQPARPASSMADTLRDAFALNDASATPSHVRAAYDRLRSFGL
ncbi:transglycosylase SLT domain-containing protein [Novosphingobium sp. MD-1]|uniref:transglycosylase SLT domain-containing protein n=1 Tax=Novosphingobium sp. MD-1 TaxID=1630648 RepID=UPI00061BFCBA|nr:transglycosylase SLT domain-containing protein [Novosphingobium sp. MD-1]GAO55285.1 phage tail fibers [Novosphingobium sp. MD-1]